MEVRVGDLILKNPDRPELGFMLDPKRVNPHIKGYAGRLGIAPEMSLTDGVPIIQEAPESGGEAPPGTSEGV